MDIDPKAPGNISQYGVASGTDNEVGFDPESPDVSDPEVDPLHPARTGNEPHNPPEKSRKVPVGEDEDELPPGSGSF